MVKLLAKALLTSLTTPISNITLCVKKNKYFVTNESGVRIPVLM